MRRAWSPRPGPSFSLGQCSTRPGGRGEARPGPGVRVALWALCSLPETVSQGWCRACWQPHSQPPPTLAPPGLPPWGREWAWPLSWSCCSCSRSPVPSTQRRFLSKHEVLIACCPESKSSYEGSGSPQGVCVCTSTCTLGARDLVCHDGQTLSHPPWVWLGLSQSASFVCVCMRIRVCVAPYA